MIPPRRSGPGQHWTVTLCTVASFCDPRERRAAPTLLFQLKRVKALPILRSIQINTRMCRPGAELCFMFYLLASL